MSSVDLVDLGLFGLGDKASACMEQELELYDHSAELEDLLSPTVQNILDISLQQSGIAMETTVETEDTMLVSTRGPRPELRDSNIWIQWSPAVGHILQMGVGGW